MTGLHGADIGALRTQAVALHDAAQLLTACAQQTGQNLDSVAWRGADADCTREEWRTQHAQVLLRCSVDLGDAARRLLDEAAAQEQASGVAGAPPPGGAGLTWADVRAAVDYGYNLTKDAVRGAGWMDYLTTGAVMGVANHRWTNITLGSSYDLLKQANGIMSDAHIGSGFGAVLTGAAVIGVVSDSYGAYHDYRAGDLFGTVDNAVSAVIGAGGLYPPFALASTGLGLSWELGTTVGTYANEEMQGTAFGNRFADRMDTAFELGGAWGMLNTPGALIVTAGEEVGLAAENLWEGLTGTGGGTVGPPQ